MLFLGLLVDGPKHGYNDARLMKSFLLLSGLRSSRFIIL